MSTPPYDVATAVSVLRVPPTSALSKGYWAKSAVELTSGAVTAVIQREFGISQPAVSAHLRVLREAGFASVRAAGTRRLYAIKPDALQEIDARLERFRAFWTPHIDALETELARGRPARRLEGAPADQSGAHVTEGERS